ncbi:lipid A biosynthesis acyltransferase [Agaribacter marinus]|uniref:Acyltransferase n=1 Tax=Agaribacter marinus TaxID=1431249 RepID=A0AA37SVY1_9ALTE|nr:lipid A biosynthesis acyltransferase [Agaribacter marinus]GLR70746.1 hypothetical protein GCM10007852_16540 [Agaribacter marinus]
MASKNGEASGNQTHWTQVQENGTVLGIKILLAIYSVFGRTIFTLILAPVMAYYYFASSVARNASKQYIKYITPYLSPNQAKELSTFKHFMQFGQMMLDKLLVWMGKIDANDIVFQTPSVVDNIKRQTRGTVIIVSHLGNIEVCNALRQKLDAVKLTIIVNTQHAQKFNSLMKQLNNESQAELLQVNDLSPATAMLLSERIDRGEMIVIAGDRTPEKNERVSNVEFLGHQTSLPQGPFILASLLKCPVHLLFCLKQGRKYHIYVDVFSEQLKFARKTREASLDMVVQEFADRLAHYCQIAPLQWFNFFPFWSVTKLEGKEKKTMSVLK